MNNKIKYSIIIPTHNRSMILKEVLDKIYKIEYSLFEVIVVDDGSTDNTKQILKDFSCKTIFHEKSYHVCKSRNDGAEIAKGEYLVFIDDDMLVPDNMFTIFDNVFRDNPDCDALFGPYSAMCRYANFASNYKSLYMFYSFYNLPKRVYHLLGGSTVIKKRVFDESGGFDEKYIKPIGEDQELGIRIGLKNKIYRCKEFIPEHIKYYNIYQLLRCDFERGLALIKMIFRIILIKKEKTFTSYATLKSYHRLNPIFIGLIPLLFLLSFIRFEFIYVGLVAYSIFIFLNIRFLNFTMKERNFLFFIRSCMFIYLDNFAISLGLVIGSIDFLLFKKKY